MDVDSPPRSRLDFKDGEEILELASPRQPRALSSLRFPPPAVTPDPEELARREARVCIIGDDDRVAARAPAVTDEARVIVPEPRAMMAPLGRAPPIIGFEPPLLGLGVASGFERLQRVGERAMPAGRAPSVEAPKNAEAKPAPRAHHEPPPQPQTPGGVKRPRPRRRWMAGAASPRDDTHSGENPCGVPTRPRVSTWPPAREYADTLKPVALSRVTDDDVPCEHFQQPAHSSMDVANDWMKPIDVFAWADEAAAKQQGGSKVTEAFRVSI